MWHDRTIEDLESNESQLHHRRERRLERVGWFVMGAIIVGALLGGLGPGPLSRRHVETPDHALAAEYSVIVRYEAPAELAIRLLARPDGAPVRLSLSRSFGDRCTVETIVPEPLQQQASDTDVAYSFAVAPHGETMILFRFNYDDFGLFDHRLVLDDGEPLEFRHYVLP